MELTDAIKAASLMKKRDSVIDLRTAMSTGATCGWSFMVNDQRFPIPTEVKKIFADAIYKAIEYYDSEIEKI